MIGMRVRQQRVECGISQAKLAKITGIRQALLSAFELGKQNLDDNNKQLIKDALASFNEEKIQILNKKCYQTHIKNGETLSSRPRRGYKKTSKNDKYLKLLSELENKFSIKKTGNPKAVSFFAGCGGLCYGIKASGFDIVAVNELQESFKDIYRKNFSNFKFLPNDITKINDHYLTDILEKNGNIDLMLGGPPCQGFSLAGKRNIQDNRNSLFKYYLHVANIIKPKVILMENVRLLTSMKDKNGNLVYEKILQTFKEYGYNCSFFYINAKNYGVPQHRERVIFIGLRGDIKKKLSIPGPSYGISNSSLKNYTSYFTFGDAVSDLEFIESGEKSKHDQYHKAVNHPEHVIKWLIDVPEGKSAHDNVDKSLRPPSGYNTTYKRQAWNEIGSTVTTTYSMISGCRNVHPIATRSLTTREAMRLQSFPDSFKLTGKLGDIRTTIGNAVPPLLAYAMGVHIKDNYIL